MILAAKFNLGHGLTDRFVRVVDGHYYGCDGCEITEPLVEAREATAEERAEFEGFEKEVSDGR